ncbi:MAG: hypothetical protein LBE36_05915 [Flavobacteriaceae bacterium]|nr:hypothetical protein [Flavobacteriaceae bacterium]
MRRFFYIFGVKKYLNNAATVANVSGEVSYNTDKLEKEFLKFVRDKMNMTGLKLFKVENNGKNTEIYLENGSRKTNPCP